MGIALFKAGSTSLFTNNIEYQYSIDEGMFIVVANDGEFAFLGPEAFHESFDIIDHDHSFVDDGLYIQYRLAAMSIVSNGMKTIGQREAEAISAGSSLIAREMMKEHLSQNKD